MDSKEVNLAIYCEYGRKILRIKENSSEKEVLLGNMKYTAEIHTKEGKEGEKGSFASFSAYNFEEMLNSIKQYLTSNDIKITRIEKKYNLIISQSEKLSKFLMDNDLIVR